MFKQVSTLHYRYFDSPWSSVRQANMPVSTQLRSTTGYKAHGGYTVVVIHNQERDTYHIGISRCSEKDHYIKKAGRGLALVRAIEAMEKGVKFSFPTPQGKIQKLQLQSIIKSLPMRYLFDESSVRSVV